MYRTRAFASALLVLALWHRALAVELLASSAVALPFDELSRNIVVRYDRNIIDSKAKTQDKARELAAVEGVTDASVLGCIGMVVLTCESLEKQKQLLVELVAHPHVEFAGNSTASANQCKRSLSGVADESIQKDLNWDLGFANLFHDAVESTKGTPAPTLLGNADDATVVKTQVDSDVSNQSSAQVTGAERAARPLTPTAHSMLDHPPEIEQGPVNGTLVIPGLDMDSVGEQTLHEIFQRTLSASLSNGSDAVDIALLNVSSLSFKATVIALPRKPGNNRRLRHRASVKVMFQYNPLGNGRGNTRRSVEAQLRLLTQGGRAAERFDVALDAELSRIGVSLPDDSTSYFSIPFRPHRQHHRKTQTDEDVAVAVGIVLGFILLMISMAILASCFFSEL